MDQQGEVTVRLPDPPTSPPLDVTQVARAAGEAQGTAEAAQRTAEEARRVAEEAKQAAERASAPLPPAPPPPAPVAAVIEEPVAETAVIDVLPPPEPEPETQPEPEAETPKPVPPRNLLQKLIFG